MNEKYIKEIRINVPDGYEVDKENSTFEHIKLKPIENKRWRDDRTQLCKGFYIDLLSCIEEVFDGNNIPKDYNIFATQKQAKSALAMARISQIMANDERFGGVVADEMWDNTDAPKYVIRRIKNKIDATYVFNNYYFLAFHTIEQRDLFIEENEDLLRDYLML